jgi:hypothetical protein
MLSLTTFQTFSAPLAKRCSGAYLTERAGDYLRKGDSRRASSPSPSLLTLMNKQVLRPVSKC